MNDLQKQRNKRAVGFYEEALAKLTPVLPGLVASGDLVAAYMEKFVNNANEIGATELRKWCNFDFTIVPGTNAIAAFVVYHTRAGVRTDYFTAERRYKPGDHGTEEAQRVAGREVALAIQERLGRRDEALNATFHVLNDIILLFLESLDSVVSWKKDNGLHVMIKEPGNKDLYVQLYFGAAFAE